MERVDEVSDNTDGVCLVLNEGDRSPSGVLSDVLTICRDFEVSVADSWTVSVEICFTVS